MNLEINFASNANDRKWTAKDPNNAELEAYMSYVQAGEKTIIIDHKVVPDGFTQKGTGKALLKEAINYMREHTITTMPSCPFVLSQLKNTLSGTTY